MKYHRPILLNLEGNSVSAHCVSGSTPAQSGRAQGCYEGEMTAGAGKGHTCLVGGSAHACKTGAVNIAPENTCKVGLAPSTCLAGTAPADLRDCSGGSKFTP